MAWRCSARATTSARAPPSTRSRSPSCSSEAALTTPFDITVDCAHPASLARWWAAVLPGYDVRPYDDEEIARLADLGLTPETDTGVMVDGPPGAPTICFQLVPDGKTVKNRLHLDLRGVDVDVVIAAGATVVHVGDGHVTLQDPEGNELCVMDVPQAQLQGLAPHTGHPPA